VRAVLAGCLADHAHGAFDDFGGMLLHGSIFSNNGASTKPGAVHRVRVTTSCSFSKIPRHKGLRFQPAIVVQMHVSFGGRMHRWAPKRQRIRFVLRDPDGTRAPSPS
jgi:hypothetical protein